MDDSHIEATLAAVQDLFDEKPTDVETGVPSDRPAMLQLRTACRLLEAARHLKAENGSDTVVIEPSFAAIERSLQCYVIDTGFYEPAAYVDHRTVSKRSSKAGRYSEEFK